MRSLPLILAWISLLTTPILAIGQSSPPGDPTPNKAAPLADLPPASVREGAHFINRTGRLARGGALRPSIFYFDPDGASPATPPMIVLKNLNLFAMESIQGTRTQPIGFIISGTVSEYKGHNYILIDQATTTLTKPGSPEKSPASATHPAAVVQPTQKNQDPNSPSTTAPVTDSSPGDTMLRLLATPPTLGEPLAAPIQPDGPTVDRTTGPGAVAPAAVPLPVVREGTHLINRTGRLSHSPDGKDCIFTFDSDGQAMKDPPMLVLPNLKLQTMEDSNKNLSKDTHFRVSGTVTEYKGRNYIELDKAVTMADVEVQF